MNRSRLVRTAVPLAAVVAAAGAGTWALRSAAAPAAGSTGPLHVGADRVATASFRTFDGCPALLEYLRAQARPLVGPYGLPGTSGPYSPMAAADGGVPGPAASASAAREAAPANAGNTSDSGTNVQVAGVDEADVSKRSGDLVLTVAGSGNGLTVLRTSGDSPQVAGRLATDFHPDQLLVSGATVLLFGTEPGAPLVRPRTATGSDRDAPEILPAPAATARTHIAEVDIADPAHPRLVRTLALDGSSAGVRLSGGLVQMALSAPPSRLPLVQPSPTADDPSGAAATTQARARNRAVVESSTVEQWLPGYTFTPANGRSTSGSVVDCSRVGVPDRFSGLATLTLLTFDLRTQGLAQWDAAGVVASGTTLYATAEHAYVATTPWQQRGGPIRADGAVGADGPVDAAVPPGETRTMIHEFATDAGRVRYLGSGAVTGTLLGQYALDEYQGRLRVATTQGPSGGIVYPMVAPGRAAGDAVSPGPTPVPVVPRVTPSSSAVTVLGLGDGALRQIGRVDGLGRGEALQSVRFAGPIGYVVTFRQTDPLFTLDLADPAHPKVSGELRMPGYSAYLHPLAGNLLLGVGRDASTDGLTNGVLVSLFDVADPVNPRLLDRVTVPGAWSGVEADAHAFTYADGLALVPVENGVLAVPVRDGGLGTPSVLPLQRGTAGEGVVDAARMRTFADATRLWTVAPASAGAVLAVHDAADLSLQNSLRF